MSIKNFVPEFWSEKIEQELKRKHVFCEDCNREYEGKVSQKGDTVHILGVGSPTIKSLERKNAGGLIDEAEEIEDSSVSLTINQIRYFNYKVGDIDKAQAVGGVMEALNGETTEKLANEEDKYVAGLCAGNGAKLLYEEPKIVTATNVLDIIDEGLEKLFENDVSDSTKITLTIAPKFFTLFKKADIDKDTNNHELMENGTVARYGKAFIKMSNNVFRKDGVDYSPMRTKRAVAFVHALTHTEAYRPERAFADAVKGYILFDGKIVRPKEMFTINVKYQ